MCKFKHKALPILMVLTILSFSAIAFVPSAVASNNPLIVNSIADDGDILDDDGICETQTGNGICTLRAAIEEANSNVDVDTLEFNITGGGVQTITPATPMPYITHEVHIDGYTQPGSAANSAVSPAPINSVINIELDGSLAAAEFNGGLAFTGGSDGSSVRGLSIFNFAHIGAGGADGSNVGIFASNVTIAGNFLGLRANGTTIGSGSNDAAILMSDTFGPITDNVIGGALPADRNILYSYSTSNITAGIFGGAAGSVFYGNYFGMARDGVTDLSPTDADTTGLQGPYTIAINLVSVGNMQIGGPATGQKNLISGGTAGVILSSDNNVVQGNYIGTDYTGNVNSSITNGVGISATAGSNNLVGGTEPGTGNIIAGVKGAGITLSSFHLNDADPGTPGEQPMDIYPQGNSILGNSIYDISIFNFDAFGDMNQAIDQNNMIDSTLPGDFRPDSVELQGPTPNDVGDVDSGANNMINTPLLTSAQQVGQNLNVNFDLDVAGSVGGDYRVEFFANDRATIFGFGPGQTYLGSTNTTTGNGKTASIDIDVLDVVGKSLSATVTTVDLTVPLSPVFGETSEFAQNIIVGSGTDFDADTISDAIEDAAPNGGDANDDGTPDSDQSTVSSFVSATSGDYTTFVTDICYSNGFVDSLSSDEIADTDTGFAYPYGLTDFVLNCPLADTITIDKYIFTPETNTSDLSVRKYRPDTHTFEAVDGTIVSENIGGEHALHLSYDITDGGALDDDGEANGVIVDPVGMAKVLASSENRVRYEEPVATAQGTLSATGANSGYLANIAFAILITGVAMALIAKSKFRKSPIK